MRVAGVDLSLRSTGVAVADRPGDDPWTDPWKVDVNVVAPKTIRGLQRLRWVTAEILELVHHADVVVIEGPAYNATPGQQGHHERAGLWWRVVDHLDALGHHVLVASPATLKMYATGKGKASKALVSAEVARRFPMVDVAQLATDDASDAVVLAALGAAHLGIPLVAVPLHHRKAVLTLATIEGTTPS